MALNDRPEYWWLSPVVDSINVSAIVQQKLNYLDISTEARPVQRGESVFVALVGAKVFDYCVG